MLRKALYTDVHHIILTSVVTFTKRKREKRKRKRKSNQADTSTGSTYRALLVIRKTRNLCGGDIHLKMAVSE